MNHILTHMFLIITAAIGLGFPLGATIKEGIYVMLLLCGGIAALLILIFPL